MKNENQKLKLLYLRDFLFAESDENHVLSMNDILEYLKNLGISAERKGIYRDIEALSECGADIMNKKEKGKSGYFVASRDFELAELKMLVDIIQASKFVTKKESEKLIKKLECLCSKYEARSLARQIFIGERVKTENEKIYYSVDGIYSAINDNKPLNFKYFNYNYKKEKVYHKNGELYTVSPYALVWNNDNYYFVGYDNDAGEVKHFRVDKMEKVSVSDSAFMVGEDKFRNFDTASYAKKHFDMYGGDECRIDIAFDESLVGVMLDRFGMDVPIYNKGDHIEMNVPVVLSPSLYGWIATFGGKVSVMSPDFAVKEFKKHIRKCLK